MPPCQEGPAEEEDAIIRRRLRSAVTLLPFWLKVAGSATLAERAAQASALVQGQLERARLKTQALKDHGVGGSGC